MKVSPKEGGRLSNFPKAPIEAQVWPFLLRSTHPTNKRKLPSRRRKAGEISFTCGLCPCPECPPRFFSVLVYLIHHPWTFLYRDYISPINTSPSMQAAEGGPKPERRTLWGGYFLPWKTGPAFEAGRHRLFTGCTLEKAPKNRKKNRPSAVVSPLRGVYVRGTGDIRRTHSQTLLLLRRTSYYRKV